MVLCVYLQNGQNMDASYDFSKCIGLKVKPRRGDGLLFYSLFPNGTIDLVSYSSEFGYPAFSVLFITMFFGIRINNI